jgi:hypothetical protein
LEGNIENELELGRKCKCTFFSKPSLCIPIFQVIGAQINLVPIYFGVEVVDYAHTDDPSELVLVSDSV